MASGDKGQTVSTASLLDDGEDAAVAEVSVESLLGEEPDPPKTTTTTKTEEDTKDADPSPIQKLDFSHGLGYNYGTNELNVNDETALKLFDKRATSAKKEQVKRAEAEAKKRESVGFRLSEFDPESFEKLTIDRLALEGEVGFLEALDKEVPAETRKKLEDLQKAHDRMADTNAEFEKIQFYNKALEDAPETTTVSVYNQWLKEVNPDVWTALQSQIVEGQFDDKAAAQHNAKAINFKSGVLRNGFEAQENLLGEEFFKEKVRLENESTKTTSPEQFARIKGEYDKLMTNENFLQLVQMGESLEALQLEAETYLEKFPEQQKEITDQATQQAITDKLYRDSNWAGKFVIDVGSTTEKILGKLVKDIATLPRSLSLDNEFGWTDRLAKSTEDIIDAWLAGATPSSVSRNLIEDVAIVNGKQVVISKGKVQSVRDPDGFVITDKNQVNDITQEYNNNKEIYPTNVQTNYDTFFPKFLQMAGDMSVLMLGAGKGTAFMKGLGATQKTAQAVGLSGAVMGQTHNQAYNDAIRNNMSPAEASKYALAVSASVATIAQINPQYFVFTKPGMIKEITNQTARAIIGGTSRREAYVEAGSFIFKQGLREAAEETAEIPAETMIKALANNMTQGRADFDLSQEMNEYIESAVLGFVGGVTFSPMGVRSRSRMNREALSAAVFNPEGFRQTLKNNIGSEFVINGKQQTLTPELVENFQRDFDEIVSRVNEIEELKPLDFNEHMHVSELVRRKMSLERANASETLLEDKRNSNTAEIDKIDRTLNTIVDRSDLDMHHEIDGEILTKQEFMDKLQEPEFIARALKADIEFRIQNDPEAAEAINTLMNEQIKRTESTTEGGKFTMKRTDDGVVLVNNETGKETTRKDKRFKEALEVFKNENIEAYKTGKLALNESHIDLDEAEADRLVTETSENPREVAQVYLKELHATDQALDGSKDDIIASYLTRFPFSSIKRFGDTSTLVGKEKKIIFNYVGKTGIPLDAQIEGLSEAAGFKITENDVIDFINRYPDGRISFSQRTQRLVDLEERFELLTGFPINQQYAAQLAGKTQSDVDAVSDEVNEIIETQGITADNIDALKEDLFTGFPYTEDDFNLIKNFLQDGDTTIKPEKTQEPDEGGPAAKPSAKPEEGGAEGQAEPEPKGEVETKDDIETKTPGEPEAIVAGDKRLQEIDDQIDAERAKPNRDEAKLDVLRKEFNTLEKQLEKEERDRVFNIPLEGVIAVLDELIEKEKTGSGTFAELSELRRAKEVVNQYTDKEGLAISEIKKDFISAVLESPSIDLADGLKLRESIRAANEVGVDIKELIDAAVKRFTIDGFSEEQGKGVIASKLEPFIKGVTVDTISGKIEPVSKTEPVPEPIVPVEGQDTSPETDILASEIQADIDAIEAGTTTPQKTGIGKKFTQLKELDQKKHDELVAAFKPVFTGFKVAQAKLETEGDIATRKSKGQNKVAEGLSDLATSLGAKKSIVSENPLSNPDVFKAVQKIVDGIVDIGVANAEELIIRLKEKLGDRIDPKFIDEFESQFLEGREFAKSEPPSEDRKPPAGEIPVFTDENVGFVVDVAEKTQKFFKKNFTSKGLLPKSVFDKSVLMTASTNAMVREISFTTKKFKKGLKAAYGKNVTEEHLVQIDQVLKGELDMDALPEALHESVGQMRDQVDALSQRLIDDGIVQGDLIGQIQENLGVYLTRSYEVHDNPKWKDKVPADIKNRAVAYLNKKFPKLTGEELEGKINELLDAPEAPLQLISSGKLGSKDLGILQKRKDIAPEIRALLGEHTDPLLNYARSITKMAHLISNSEFLESVKTEGLGDFLFEKPTTEHHRKIASEGSKTMEPLNGLYTTPEIAEAFESMGKVTELPPWLKWYMKANGVVKYSKTILSYMTHVRNLVGNTGFAIMNGHYRAGKMATAVQTTINELGKMDKADFKDRYERYLRLGLVGESTNAGEMNDVIQDAMKEKGDIDKMTDNAVVKFLKTGRKLVNDLYMAEDDVWKIYAFENEMVRYRKAFPKMSEEKLEEKVVEIVRNTYPTYSLVPEAIKQLRKVPLVGTFVSFPAEVVRTAYNTAELAIKEIKDPKTKSIGLTRVAGMMTAAGLSGGAAAASAFMYGIGDDEDEAIRRYLAPWSKNSPIISLSGVENGKYQYIDVGYSDPHSYLKKPIMAMLSGDDPLKSMDEALEELYSPFLGEEILATRLLDIARNKKQSGAPVYNEQGTLGDIAAAKAKHIAEAMEPGTLTSFRRIFRGVNGEVNNQGVEYDPVTEIIALFSGQRISNLDIGQGFSFKAGTYSKSKIDARQIYTQVLNSKGDVSREDVNEAYEQANASSKILFEELRKDYQAAVTLGVPISELISSMKNNNLSSATRRSIISGVYLPLKRDIRKEVIRK